MKTLMIIGAGKLQVPAYCTAKKMNIRVVGIDRDFNAPGMKLANVAYVVDTRDAVSAIEVAKKEKIDGVMTLCTDFPVRTVAAVARPLGLVALSPNTAFRATDKGLMRDAFEENGVPIPKFMRVNSANGVLDAFDYIGLPAIVKPRLSSGSRGVFKVDFLNQYKKAFEYANSICQGEDILVEEFVGGPEVSVESISYNGTHDIITITDKMTTGDPFWVETGHTQPSILSDEIQEKIRDCAKNGLDALGIDNSASHVEIIVGPDGPVLIEIGARLGGDFISTELTYRSTGVNMTKAAIQIAVGEEPVIEHAWKRGSAIRYIEAEPGVIDSIYGLEKAKAIAGVCDVEVYLEPGATVCQVQSSLDRVGHIITEGKDRMSACSIAEQAKKIIVINTVQS